MTADMQRPAQRPPSVKIGRKRHVVIVMPVFIPEMTSGAERQCSILAPQLASLGWKVTVLTPTVRADLPGLEETDGYSVRRIRTRSLPFLGGRYILSAVSWTLQALWWISRQRSQIDCVYVFHARLHSAPAAIAAWLWRLPLAIKLGRGGETFDFNSLDAKKGLYGRALKMLVISRTGAFVANSDQIRGDLVEAGVPEERIQLLPNGVTLAALHPCLRVPSKPTFIYAGRLAPEKNTHTLIEAFASLADEYPQARLLIAGDGPEESNLKLLAAAQNCGDRIQFLGLIDNMAHAFAQADFYVSASDAEGQSNAMLEALAAGLVTIVCDASGVRDVVSHGKTGFLIPAPNVAAIRLVLAEALSLSLEERKAMQKLGRERVERDFDIRSVASRTDEILRALVTAGGGADA